MLMKYSEWKNWISQLPWALKWFPILILLRPVIDTFYFLKEISPFFSPLYIVGVATPILATYSIIKLRKLNYSRLDTYFAIYTILVSVSCLALLISDTFSLDALDFTLKSTFLSFIYFFSRRFIISKRDLHGVMQTFLYSSILVLMIFSYELIFNPINIQISRGLERFQGTYADTMNYSIYMTGCLLISFYNYYENANKVSFNIRFGLVAFVVLFSTLLLFNIHHTASYFVVSAIIIIFLIHNLKANMVIGVSGFLLVGSLLYFMGSGTFNDKFLPLIETDILVYEGEKGDEALLHGRVGRWKNFYENFNEKSFFVQLFGLPLNLDHPYMYVGKGSHNDFVRTHMFIGYFGLIVYLLMLFSIFLRILKHNLPLHFLGTAMLAAIVLFSITTTPLLYPTFMYLFIPYIALLALPTKMIKDNQPNLHSNY